MISPSDSATTPSGAKTSHIRTTDFSDPFRFGNTPALHSSSAITRSVTSSEPGTYGNSTYLIKLLDQDYRWRGFIDGMPIRDNIDLIASAFRDLADLLERPVHLIVENISDAILAIAEPRGHVIVDHDACSSWSADLVR